MEKSEYTILPLEIRQQIDLLDSLAIISFADRQGNITYVNDLFCSVSEYSREELLGKNHRILKSGLQPDSLFSLMWKTICDGKIWKGEVLNKKKDGGFYWVDTTIAPFFNPDGTFNQFVSIRVDITKQKEQLIEIENIVSVVRNAKDELKYVNEQLENKYISVLENMNDAFVIHDLTGKITFANRRFYDIFGYNAEIDQIERLTDVILEDDKKIIGLIHSKNIAGVEIPDVFEVRAIKHNQTIIWLEIKSTLIVEGNKVVGTQFIIRDISERKRVETERYDLAELNRKIIESSDELFYVIDVQKEGSFNNPLKYISPQVNIILGVSESELLGKKNRLIDFVNPEDLKVIKNSMYDLFLSKKPVMVQFRLFNQIMNEHVWVENYSSPYMDPSGKIIEIYGSIKDINDQRRSIEKIDDERRHTLAFQYQLLCSQLNPHFIYNVLNSLQYYILGGKIEDSLNYVSSFSTLMRKVLDNSTKPFITLNDEISFIRQYIDISKQQKNQNLEVRIIIDPTLDLNDHLIPPMLLQPYVENAILHAFPDKKIASPVLKINFSLKNNRVYCMICDNGIGRQESLKLKSKSGGKNKSRAIQINQSRVELLNRIHSNKFQIEINDVNSSTSQDSGTIVVVSFDEIS